MLIEFGQIGSHLGSRFAGASFRDKITNSFYHTEKFVFDFTGVETVSNSFADECFAKLIYSFEMEEIKKRTSFQNTSSRIKSVIANAFKERLLQETVA